MKKTDQEPESADDLAASSPPGADEIALRDVEVEPPPSPDQQWDSAAEEEWNEHSATAWALAYVIHRIRSTPYPPVLLPEQRDHFQKVIEMAAALMEEWQRRERDQAQQLAQARPKAELRLVALEAIPNGLDDHAAEVWEKQLFTLPYQLPREDEEEDASDDPSKAQGTPAAAGDDYQI